MINYRIKEENQVSFYNSFCSIQKLKDEILKIGFKVKMSFQSFSMTNLDFHYDFQDLLS